MCWYFRLPFFSGTWLFGFPLMMMGSLIFWFLIVGLLFYYLRHLLKNSTKETNNNLDNILKQKLIEGKITHEEYNRLKELLS